MHYKNEKKIGRIDFCSNLMPLMFAVGADRCALEQWV